MKSILRYLFLAIITIAISSPCVMAQQGGSTVSVIRGPYLQFPTDTSMIVKWRTDSATDSRVYYGTDMQNLTDYVDVAEDTINHTVEITGLQPYTDYYYSIGTPNEVLSGPDEDHRFKTSPGIGEVGPMRIWAIGDFGKGSQKQEDVWRAYVEYADDDHTDVWLWLGDNAYDDGLDSEYQNKVFDSIHGYYEIMKYMPFMPSPGNHDYGSISPPFQDVPPLQQTGAYFDIIEVPTNGELGGVASGHELFYSFDYRNVHFLSLNSELGSLTSSNDDWIGANPFSGSFNGSPFTDWLEADLQANDKPWVIAYFHQPPHTAGSHDSGAFWEVYMKAMRENIIPILEEYGVDLVLCGHSHVYERSYLIKGLYDEPSAWDANTMLVDGSSGVDSLGEAYDKYTLGDNANEGTVYVVCGNSGSNDSDPPLDHPAMYFAYGCSDCIGSFVIDVNGNRLDGKFLSAEGEILDNFTIHKHQTEDPSSVDEGVISSLLHPYPNPFDDFTAATFRVNEPSSVLVELVDISGRTIATLFDGYLERGEHKVEVDSKKFGLSEGVYTIRVTAGDEVANQRVVKFR